jgi:hypothetical protein
MGVSEEQIKKNYEEATAREHARRKAEAAKREAERKAALAKKKK